MTSMVVHMYRVVAQPSDKQSYDDVQTTVDEWTSQYDRVLTEQETSLTEDELDDGTTIFRGSWRFSMDESEDEITSALRTRLVEGVDWFSVKYHRCSHDSDERESCSWDKGWTYGSPPSSVV